MKKKQKLDGSDLLIESRLVFIYSQGQLCLNLPDRKPMNVLAAAGVVEQVRDASVTSHEWAFENQHGKLLACAEGPHTVTAKPES
jgi:hypothetical protein